MRRMNGPGRVSQANVCTGMGADGPGGSASCMEAAGGGATAVRSITAIGIREGIRIPSGMSSAALIRRVRNRQPGAGVGEERVDQAVQLRRELRPLCGQIARLS